MFKKFYEICEFSDVLLQLFIEKRNDKNITIIHKVRPRKISFLAPPSRHLSSNLYGFARNTRPAPSETFH